MKESKPTGTGTRKLTRIAPALVLAALGMFTGIWTGWIRMGWDFPSIATKASILHHGAIMLGGLLGTVIILERVNVLRRKWLFALPIVNGLSVPAFLLNHPQVGFVCLGIGGIGLIALFIHFCEKYKTWDQYLMLVGALCYLIGTVLLWQAHLYPVAFPWWMAFLLWTIAGERMELSRFLMIRPWQRALLISALVIFLVGCTWPYHEGGSVLMCAGLAGSGLWLLRYDMARKAIRKTGQFRFSATALMIGYFWLLASGGLMLVSRMDPLWYDAVLHTFFIGFVFSMIFAHGPIIFPALIGLTGKPYHPILWFWLLALHASLVVRILADLATWFPGREYGGLVNGIVILGYGITLGYLIARLRRSSP